MQICRLEPCLCLIPSTDAPCPTNGGPRAESLCAHAWLPSAPKGCCLSWQGTGASPEKWPAGLVKDPCMGGHRGRPPGSGMGLSCQSTPEHSPALQHGHGQVSGTVSVLRGTLVACARQDANPSLIRSLTQARRMTSVNGRHSVLLSK